MIGSEQQTVLFFTAGKTILGKKRTKVCFTTDEKLLFLRAYQAHPCNWGDVIETMRENMQCVESDSTKQYYATTDRKLIKDRLSTKLAKMLEAPDKEPDDVRYV